MFVEHLKYLVHVYFNYHANVLSNTDFCGQDQQPKSPSLSLIWDLIWIPHKIIMMNFLVYAQGDFKVCNLCT